MKELKVGDSVKFIPMDKAVRVMLDTGKTPTDILEFFRRTEYRLKLDKIYRISEIAYILGYKAFGLDNGKMHVSDMFLEKVDEQMEFEFT